MAKLDESKAAWIMRRKAEGRMTNRQIAKAMGVKVRRVQALWPGHRHPSPAEIQFPLPMGRPSGGMAGRGEHGAAAGLRPRRRAGAWGRGGPHGRRWRPRKIAGLAKRGRVGGAARMDGYE